MKTWNIKNNEKHKTIGIVAKLFKKKKNFNVS